LIGFGIGVITGRQFPAHHFERFGASRYLLDSATGKICDPMRDPNANPLDEALASSASKPQDDPFAAYGGHAVSPKDANGFPIVKPAYPAACGK